MRSGVAFALLLALAFVAPVWGADSITDHESEILAGVEQNVVDSAASEIMQALEAEQDLNTRQPVGVDPAMAGTPEANKLEAAETATTFRDKPEDAFAFLSEVDAPLNKANAIDVDSHLDSIAAELDSVLVSKEQMAAKAQAAAETASAEAFAKSKKGRLAAKRAAKAEAHRQGVAKRAAEKAAKAAAKAATSAAALAAPVAKPSRRQAKLIQRLDAYRAQRGHEQRDVSVLEATASAKSAVGGGYSLPSAYAPATAGGVAPAPVLPAAFQGQVAVNPAFVSAGVWNALGVAAPAAPAAPVLSQGVPAAGIGLLLQALKKVKEEQDTRALVSQLAQVLAAQQPAAPAVIPSPFNYGQQLVSTPAGYQNPNLWPYAAQRLLPGQIPGQSPAYPTFIPAQSASVGVEGAEQVELGH